MAAPQLSTSKKLLFTSILVFGMVALAFTVLEAGLRWRYRKVAEITGVSDWSLDTLDGLSYYWDEYHPRWGWTNVAGYRSDTRVPFQVSINSQQLRATKEYAPRSPQPGQQQKSAPPAPRRIAIFGDSCTFGEEVNDDETLPALLERHLNEVEVMNYGVHGYGLGQMFLRLQDEGFSLAPDHVILVLYLPGDVFRDSLRQTSHNKPVFSLEGPDLRIGNIPVSTASEQPWLHRHSFAAAWLFGRPRESHDAAGVDYHAKLASAILFKVQEVCAERRIPVTIVTITVAATLQAMETQPPVRKSVQKLQQSIRETTKDNLDLIDALQAEYSRRGSALVAPRGHWSPTGNDFLGARIAAHLASLKSGWRLANPSEAAAKPEAR